MKKPTHPHHHPHHHHHHPPIFSFSGVDFFFFKLQFLCLPAAPADWYPQHVEVQQEGTSVTVTFNLAPPNLGITSYFSLCAGSGRKKYMDITPVSSPRLQSTRTIFLSFSLLAMSASRWVISFGLSDFRPSRIHLKTKLTTATNSATFRKAPITPVR